MKKSIALLVGLLLVPGIALAEWVSIHETGGGSKMIIHADDYGNTRISNAYKVPAGYLEIDDQGNSRMIFDYTDNDDRDDDDD